MITAVDTNVLIDVLTGDAHHGPRSADALRAAGAAGSLVACEIVWAEVTSRYRDREAILDALDVLGLRFDAMSPETAVAAGQAWAGYRAAGGPRERLGADFLVGAHAATQADRLLTRDRGFYRRYFDALSIIDPSLEDSAR